MIILKIIGYTIVAIAVLLLMAIGANSGGVAPRAKFSKRARKLRDEAPEEFKKAVLNHGKTTIETKSGKYVIRRVR